MTEETVSSNIWEFISLYAICFVKSHLISIRNDRPKLTKFTSRIAGLWKVRILLLRAYSCECASMQVNIFILQKVAWTYKFEHARKDLKEHISYYKTLICIFFTIKLTPIILWVLSVHAHFRERHTSLPLNKQIILQVLCGRFHIREIPTQRKIREC